MKLSLCFVIASWRHVWGGGGADVWLYECLTSALGGEEIRVTPRPNLPPGKRPHYPKWCLKFKAELISALYWGDCLALRFGRFTPEYRTHQYALDGGLSRPWYKLPFQDSNSWHFGNPSHLTVHQIYPKQDPCPGFFSLWLQNQVPLRFLSVNLRPEQTAEWSLEIDSSAINSSDYLVLPSLLNLFIHSSFPNWFIRSSCVAKESRSTQNCDTLWILCEITPIELYDLKRCFSNWVPRETVEYVLNCFEISQNIL